MSPRALLAAFAVLLVTAITAVATVIPSVTVTANPASVQPGGTTTLIAGMPVSDAGTVSQEIIQTIDPAKLRLTGASNITAPSGWSLEYFDGASWSSTSPANTAAWAQLTRIKASGSIVSEGASGSGRQVASRTSTGVLATAGGSLAAPTGLDGWDVFFDPAYTRVFYRPHHIQPPASIVVACHWLFADQTRPVGERAAGDKCGGRSTYLTDSANNFTSSHRSTGWIDSRNRLWLEMQRTFGPTLANVEYGFACFDVSGSTPTSCAEGVWHRLDPTPAYRTPLDGVMDLAAIGGKLFTQTVQGRLLCLDTQAAGGPAACPGQPYALGLSTSDWVKGDVRAIAGKLYLLKSNSNDSGQAICVDPARITTGATAASIICDGWPATPPEVGGGPLVAVPNASGRPVAVCGSRTNATCVNLQDGTTTIPGIPSNVQGVLRSHQWGAGGEKRWWSGVTTAGTRIYGPEAGAIYCFDSATNAVCANWPKAEQSVYAVVPDPVNPRCVWSNADTGYVRIRDGVTGNVGCTSPSPIVSFPGKVAVPRMACSANSGIQEWVDFRVAALGSPDRRWDGAQLTVRDPSGNVVPGWDGVAIPDSGIISLATLPVSGGSGASAWVAADLDFRVTFDNPTYTSAPQATIKVIGDAPQLCLQVTAPVVCPIAQAPGPIPTPANAATMTALGDGSSTDGSNTTTPMTQGLVTVSIGAPTVAQCSGTVGGRAQDTSPTPRAVAGAQVALYDSSGTAVVYPAGHASAGQPVTATTDANGDYTFTGLAPDSYRVRFASTSSLTAVDTTVAAGGSGTVSASAGAMTSNASTVAVGGTGTINARFTVASSPTADTSSGARGAAQTITPLSNDLALSGGSLTASSLRLCVTGTANGSCTGTSLDIAGEGRYTVVNGVVTFTPCSATGVPIPSCAGAFTGPATPIKYVVSDSSSAVVSSTITPTVVPPPTAAADTQSGAYDTNQTIALLTNDAAGTGATLTASSVRLCPTNAVAPFTASNCTATSVTTSEGTYSISAGTVTFDPLPSFSGQAQAPVRYVVQDSLSQVGSALITPTVAPPTAPVATPETKPVIPGGTATFSNLITGQGALATGSGLQTGNVNGPCLVDPSDSVCKATFTIAGEGTWTVNRNTGVATFQADAQATTGAKTAVTYRVTDAVGQTATSTLTPTIPPPPTASPDTSVGVVDANQTISVLPNDTASSGTSLVGSTVRICTTATATASCTGTSLNVSGEGTYTANGDGTVTFDPLPSFTGQATPIKYVVQDSLGQKATSTITPEVVSIPAPTSTPDSTVGLPGATQLINPLVNDAPGAGAYPLDAATVRLCGPSESAPACTQTSITTSDGTFTVNPLTGFISYQPVTGMLGTAAAISYSVTDTAGQRTSSTYTPRVVGVGPPQVAPSTVAVAHGAPGIMAPQVTPGTTPIDPSKTCLAAPGATCAPGETSLTRPEGTYVLDPATGIITFTPARGYTGTPSDPPRLCVTDQVGQSACGTLTPTVAPPPVAPTPPSQGENGRPLPGAPVPSALPEIESTMAGQPVTLRALANDSPSSGAMLDPSSVRLRDPRTGRYQEQVTIPGTGTFSANPDGTITFTPQQGFIGTTPSITYRVADSLGRTATSTVTVIVRDTPPPWADPQFNQAMRGQAVSFDPLAANAAGSSPFVPSSVRIKDPATGAWTTRVVVPGQGTWTVDAQTGRVRFQPLRSFVGAATPVDYRITNARGQQVSSTLHPLIRQKPPALSITTRASHTTLRPGQRSLITLRIENHGLSTTTRTVTRAPIPKGFAVANPMGGTVRGGWVWFTTGNLRAGGGATCRFVLVATSSGVGKGNQQLTGWATSTNTRSVNDPTALRVIGAVSRKAPVTG